MRCGDRARRTGGVGVRERTGRGAEVAEQGAAPILTSSRPAGGVSELALHQGVLRLGSDEGCPGVEAGGRFVPVVWPTGWTVQVEAPGTGTLLDDRGRVVAVTGDRLSLGGGLVGEDHPLGDDPCATSEPFAAGAVTADR